MKTEKSRQWTSQVIKPALTQRGTITNETRGQHNLHNNASNQLLVVRHEGSPDGISLLPGTWFRCCPAPLSPAAGLTFAGEDRRCAQKWESKDQGFLNRQEAWFRFFPDEWTRYWTMVNEIREITAALALPDHWRVRGYGIVSDTDHTPYQQQCDWVAQWRMLCGNLYFIQELISFCEGSLKMMG